MMLKSKQKIYDNILLPYDTMVNTILGWNYGPFYDILRHIWGRNDVLALQKVKIS